MYAEQLSRRDPPCPICNSANVRWRKRHVYDFVFTWSRTLIQGVYSTLSGRGRLAGYRMGSTRDWRVGEAYEYDRHLEALEEQTGYKVGTRYWTCRDCGNKGQIFD